MTKKQELYNKIREIRNKHFPPKLEFGCEVEVKSFFLPDELQNTQQIVCKLNPVSESIVTASGNDVFLVDIVNILGKPVSLNDVLRMCKILKKEVAINTDGFLFWEYKIDDGLGIEMIDLSLPISEQSEETLEALLKLIK